MSQLDNNLAIQDAQKLAVSNLVCLYTIQITDNLVLNLTPHSNDSQIENITVGGVTFISTPIEMSDLEYGSSGASPRPTLTIGNIEGAFSNVNFASSTVYETVLGSKVTKRTTFQKFIDKFNDEHPTGGNLEIENNLVLLRKEKYLIDRVASKNIVGVSFELASPYDLNGIKVPTKVVYSGHCPYVYKGASNYETNRELSQGGCNWNNLVRSETTSVLGTNLNIPAFIYMNSQDEYIVKFDANNFITPIPIDDGNGSATSDDIKKGHYYYEENSSTATKIQNNGELIENTLVNDYWQALFDIDAASLDFEEHYPNDNSRFWRRIRVFEEYDPDKTFSGYVDKRLNEYVSVKNVSASVDSTTITSFTDQVIISALGSDVTVRVFDITSDVIQFTNQEINNLVIFTSENIPLKKIQIDLQDPLFGLKKVDEFVVVSNANGSSIEYRIFTLALEPSFTLSTTLDPYLNNVVLYQVAGRTQFAGFHRQAPSISASEWRTGDVCGKALSSCSLRFQGKVVFETAADSALAANVNLSQISVDFNSTNFPSNGEILIEEGYEFLNNVGYVTPYIGTINVVEFDALNQEPAGAISPSTDLITNSVVVSDGLNVSSDPNHANTHFRVLDGSTVHLKDTAIGKLHAVKIGDNPREFPVPADPSGFAEPAQLESITLAYQKVSGNKIKLFVNDNCVDGLLDSPSTIINTGTAITFSGVNFGTMELIFNKLITFVGGGTIAAAETIEYPTQAIFFDFLSTTDSSAEDYNNYIATDRATSISLPFGGFPGTKRFA